ncbi:hypothetical protein EMIHUDRAFT_450370 [Emiliania huxleyi CCMP1516]|uniref:CDP-diacylglycerol--inositol 3-phosphatidyltransferase n=2 Tax=Emiliania huxleyi TaxID=2903 RepID=A0A0D3JQH8_EMIH1|nr:hypothetical protein EMIHUDRAFT_450370 [Emiliania huxleyi CCMP1516]EOD25763.1 hypothetical protein EMIHUDRAFT_450370 [Emiliania huxleyi CCMP1516]|eukprot:XP_005778192.1 hypothetical protein EMIHUDRAFT_450370 [Emiliania huxleyi CCMP1516]
MPRSWPVLLWAPNVIGYVRIVLTFVGYHYAMHDWRLTVGTYGLDAADGLAARLLGQSSTFGAVLDMTPAPPALLPEAVTAGGLGGGSWSQPCVCACAVLCALVTLDMFSHWYHMYASLKLGLGSHKESTRSNALRRSALAAANECENALLRFYYKKPVLFVACAGTEFWYVAMYAAHFADAADYAGLVLRATLPIMLFKQVCNAVQLGVAMRLILEYDEQERQKAEKAA